MDVTWPQFPSSGWVSAFPSPPSQATVWSICDFGYVGLFPSSFFLFCLFKNNLSNKENLNKIYLELSVRTRVLRYVSTDHIQVSWYTVFQLFFWRVKYHLYFRSLGYSNECETESTCPNRLYILARTAYNKQICNWIYNMISDMMNTRKGNEAR